MAAVVFWNFLDSSFRIFSYTYWNYHQFRRKTSILLRPLWFSGTTFLMLVSSGFWVSERQISETGKRPDHSSAKAEDAGFGGTYEFLTEVVDFSFAPWPPIMIDWNPILIDYHKCIYFSVSRAQKWSIISITPEFCSEYRQWHWPLLPSIEITKLCLTAYNNVNWIRLRNSLTEKISRSNNISRQESQTTLLLHTNAFHNVHEYSFKNVRRPFHLWIC